MTLEHLGGHVRHPAPVNQFYRLEYDETRKVYEKTTRWNHVHRDADGVLVNWDGLLCMATAGAVAIDAHTGGQIKSSPGKIHDAQGDQKGGIGVDDIETAWARIWDADLIRPDGYNWIDTRTALRSRRGVVIAVDYAAMPDQWKAQLPGDFAHALYLDDWRESDGAILVYDSLRTMPVWMPEIVVRRAAEAIARQQRGTVERLFVGLTAIRPLIGAASPHYAAVTIIPTSVWNDQTRRWVFRGTGMIPVERKFEVRGARYIKGSKSTYAITSGSYSTSLGGGGYFMPTASVKLTRRLT